MRVEYMSMANGPENSPPGATVPTPQLTILGLMVKLETWWATESSVYMPTPVPGMAASSARRLAPAGRPEGGDRQRQEGEDGKAEAAGGAHGRCCSNRTGFPVGWDGP